MIPNHVVNELFHSSHFLITLKYQQSIHIQKYTDVYMIYIYIYTNVHNLHDKYEISRYPLK